MALRLWPRYIERTRLKSKTRSDKKATRVKQRGNSARRGERANIERERLVLAARVGGIEHALQSALAQWAERTRVRRGH